MSDRLVPLESSSDILVTLLLCGLMGLLGQGIRAAVGLKNALSAPAGMPARHGHFNGAYFATSLLIGFIAGDLAGVGIGLDRLMRFDTGNLNVLVGIAAAGYAGVDFIENSFSNLVPFIGRPAVQRPLHKSRRVRRPEQQPPEQAIDGDPEQDGHQR